MKKLTSVILTILILSASTNTLFASGTANGIVLNGKDLSLDVKPVVEQGRTLVPARAIFENLGFTVAWNNTTRKVTATKGNDKMILTVGEPWENFYNRIRFSSDVLARIIDNRTLVPVRIISEIVGLEVDWDNQSRKVIINNSDNELPVSLSQAYNILYNKLIDDPSYDLMYMPLDSYASSDVIASKSNYIFSDVADYGYGIEISGDINYLVNKYTGKIYTYDPR